MSGRKQHHIPQFFLEGFARPGSGKNPQVWNFRKGAAPYLSAVKDSAAARHFYSPLPLDGEETLDTQITDYEGKLAQLVADLRSVPSGARADAGVAAEVVTHLAIRTEYLRSAFEVSAVQIFGAARDIFSDSDRVTRLLGLESDEPSEQFRTELRRRLAEMLSHGGAVGIPERVFERIIFDLAKENSGSIVRGIVPAIANACDDLIARAEAVARDGQTKALGKELAPAARVRALAEWTWTVHSGGDTDMILPDCVALGRERDGILHPLMATSLEEIDAVVLPLSSSQVLVGFRRPSDSTEFRDLNEDAAACSHAFFIAANRDAELLIPRIGERAVARMSDSISEAVQAFGREQSALLLSEVPADEPACGEDAVVHQPKLQVEFPVSFRGWPEPATIPLVGREIEELIVGLPLGRLDGITIASDYPAAVSQLDRGAGELGPIATTDDESSTSISTTPIVVRDGIIKGHIVIRAEVATGLLSENAATKRSAAHAFTYALGHVICIETVDTAFPGFLLGSLSDQYQAILYPHGATAWTSYVAARVSGACDPSVVEDYEESLRSAVTDAMQHIPDARFAYRFDGDLDNLMGLALRCVGRIIDCAARLLGHLDGLNPAEARPSPDLGFLSDVGLGSWTETLHRDLDKLWDSAGRWSSVAEFFRLNRHVERLLWPFGIVCWQEGDAMRVAVPLGTDAARLEHDAEPPA